MKVLPCPGLLASRNGPGNMWPTPPPNAVALYDSMQQLKLNVATIAPIHGRGAVPVAELRRFLGRR